MRQQSFTLFDEYLPASATTYTSTDFNTRLGAFDEIVLHTVADNMSTTGRLDIFVEHSGDGRNWMQRNSMALGSGAISTTGDISLDLSSGGFVQLLWADAAATSSGNVRYTGTTNPTSMSNMPLLPFVRLRLTTGSGSGAHVKIHATLCGPR